MTTPKYWTTDQVDEKLSEYRNKIATLARENVEVIASNKSLIEDKEKLKAENERLQRESKWNLEQCVKLRAELSEARRAGRNEAIDEAIKKISDNRKAAALSKSMVIELLSSLKL